MRNFYSIQLKINTSGKNGTFFLKIRKAGFNIQMLNWSR